MPGSWHGVRALVTGATGFIGAHLVRRLTGLGAVVHAVSRQVRDHVDGGETWHVADLCDADRVGAVLRAAEPDVVFHLASEVTGAREVRLVRPTLESNLDSAVNLLTAVADAAPAGRLVLAGSVEEPRPEDGAAAACSPYAVAKWAVSGYARMFHELWDVPVTTLRISMVYGPGQRDLRKLIPYATTTLLRGEVPELTSGTRLVDWIYVDDVVDAFLAAASSARAPGQVFDIGSGTQLSIRDTVELLAKIIGAHQQPRFGAIADRPLDRAQVADIGPAGDLLDWRPRVGLETGLRRTADWYSATL
ncbi:NAD-dependent epimerase/dehydratase family protein [Kutzneria kofuensis]|uniref:Nucleoside-diphosphate-sugar epimerase n=1 Tax=Kutzneria kofuensis TaxID=103725 RepID=A0A7W9KEF7_9PSEU|nr:NAD-dependent epimerase/dehydratase family protein [Kutzneria kofuensis]MBB5891105.1 nucleoside-diphosphate-sugar epimerase [Kutzneria kofuensis]